MIDEEFSRKIVGVLAICAVTPLKLVTVADKIRLYVGDKFIHEFKLSLFAKLSPHEILKLAGLPRNKSL